MGKSMNKHSEKGNGVLEIAAIIVLVGIIAAAVFLVQNNKNKEDKTIKSDNAESVTATETTDQKEPLTADSSKQEVSETPDQSAKQYSDDQYVTIKEWGVKIGVGIYADKITVSAPSEEIKGRSELTISVKPAYDEYVDCTSLIFITRLTDVSGFDKPPVNKIGNYYYYNSGVSECGGAKPSNVAEPVTFRKLVDAFNEVGVKAL